MQGVWRRRSWVKRDAVPEEPSLKTPGLVSNRRCCWAKRQRVRRRVECPNFGLQPTCRFRVVDGIVGGCAGRENPVRQEAPVKFKVLGSAGFTMVLDGVSGARCRIVGGSPLQQPPLT
jgi:hypothetical protein